MKFWKNAEAESGIRINYQERVDAIDADGTRSSSRPSKKKYRDAFRAARAGPARYTAPTRRSGRGTAEGRLQTDRTASSTPAKRVLVVGGGDSALEAALAVADAPDAKVTLSYRSAAFSRTKLRNRQLVDAAHSARQDRSEAAVQRRRNRAAARAASRQRRSPPKVANDEVIVCAGGILPTDFLRRVGIHIETKYGTE